jgi:hypothetical protein
MPAMRVVQVPGHQVIHVIAMRHCFVTASRSVLVSRIVPRALVLGCAGIRIGSTHFDHVLIEMIPVRLMQMTVVQIIDMVVVPDGHMATPCAMNV